MNNYKFNYYNGDAQRNEDFLLTHDKLFSQEELKNIIIQIKNNGKRKDVYEVISLMVEMYGFKKLEFTYFQLGSDYDF